MGFLDPRDFPLNNWMKRALCHGQSDIFFGPAEEETISQRRAREALAKGICNECPVRFQCHEASLLHDNEGIWAGTTQKERKKLRAARRKAGDFTHGRSAYRMGKCRCPICREANTISRRAQRNKDIPPHVVGSVSLYKNWGCRCDSCKEIAQDYGKARRGQH